MTRDNRLYLAWVVALVATLGSLYLSEIRHFNPCPLCWFQRIFMYPQAILLGIAAFSSDLRIRRYAIPLSVIGALIALFHNMEMWGIIEAPKMCTADPAASCGTPWPVWGMDSPLNTILSIPMLSLLAFSLITALLSWKRERVPTQPVSAEITA